jgi:hypothetical protein
MSLAAAVLINLADTNAPAAPVSPQRSPTPNVALFITPTATVPPPTPTAAPPTPTPLRGGGVVAAATVIPRGQATASPPPPPTAVYLPPACPDPSVRITSPGIDARLSGVVSVAGTADIPNFQYYKVEYGAGEPPQSWHVLGDVRRRQVSGGVLETFNAGAFPPGVYYLRLTVVDLTGNFPIAPCAVRVVLGP